MVGERRINKNWGTLYEVLTANETEVFIELVSNNGIAGFWVGVDYFKNNFKPINTLSGLYYGNR